MSVPRAVAALLLLSLPLLAGCTRPDDTQTTTVTFTATSNPIPFGGAHDHADPEQHRFASNATLVDHLSLQEFGASRELPVGAHAVDVKGDLLVVGVNSLEQGGSGQQGFHLIDVSDPASMRHLSFYKTPLPVDGDRTVALSDDGKTVFLGYEGKGVRPGVAAVDVSDPTSPREVAFWDDPQDYGSHTVSTAVIDGQTYVFSLALGVNILRFDPPQSAGGTGTLTLVGKYLTSDQLAALDAINLVNRDSPTDTTWQTYARRSLYGHDMTYYHDPVTDKHLLLVAYAYEGLKVVDVGTPSAPVLLARWMPPQDSETIRFYTHSATAERGLDGKLIVVVGSETFEPQHLKVASPIWVLDATAALSGLPLQVEPELLATWRNPGGAPSGRLGLSVHFFRQQEGYLYLSHYHGGVWAFDLRTDASRREMAPMAYIMPVPDNAVMPPEDCCYLGSTHYALNGIPMTFDVAYAKGHVFAADVVQGVQSIRIMYPPGGEPVSVPR